MSRVAVFPQRVRVRVAPVKRKKTRVKRVVTPGNWRVVLKRLARLEAAHRKLRKRLQKAGL